MDGLLMTSRERALLFSPTIVGLTIALAWAIVDRILQPLGRPPR